MMSEIHGLGASDTTKPDGEIGEFCGDQEPEGYVSHIMARLAENLLQHVNSARVWQYGIQFYKNKVNHDSHCRQLLTTEQDWAVPVK